MFSVFSNLFRVIRKALNVFRVHSKSLWRSPPFWASLFSIETTKLMHQNDNAISCLQICDNYGKHVLGLRESGTCSLMLSNHLVMVGFV